MQNLSIQNVLKSRDKYNLAIPFVETQQISPFHKMSVSLLYVDPNGREVYKVGSNNQGNGRWEDLYSLAKPFLNKLATEAGIQFSPGSGDVVKMDENTWKASAFGTVKLPDGNLRTSNDFKVIDLVTEEKKYRLSYEEKAARGISDYKASKEVAKKYAGEWVDTGQVNSQGYPVKMYVIAECDRAKYVENSLLDAMTQLRANAPQKAATGAILRVIRALLGIKSTYTIEELKKPFAVARMSFSPDYNDPVTKQMLLQQAMQSVGNLFGNTQPVMQTISIQQPADDDADLPADIYEEPVLPSTEEVSIQRGSHENQQAPAEKPGRIMTEKDRAQDFCCDKCGRVIPKKVWNYSYENMGRPLCFACQKTVRNEQGGRR